MKLINLQNITDWLILFTALLTAILGMVFVTEEMLIESGIAYGVAALLMIVREVIKIRIILEHSHKDTMTQPKPKRKSK